MVSSVLRLVRGQEYALSEPAMLGDVFAYEENFFPDRRAVDDYLATHKQDFNDCDDRYFAFWEGGKKQFGSGSLPGYDPGNALAFGAYPFKAEDWIFSTNGRIVVLPLAPAQRTHAGRAHVPRRTIEAPASPSTLSAASPSSSRHTSVGVFVVVFLLLVAFLVYWLWIR